MVISLTCFLVAFIFICIYLYKNFEVKPENFPPGPPNIPVFGGYLSLLLANYTYTHKAAELLCKLYKSDVIGVYIGSLRCIFVNTYKLGKEALTKAEFNGRPDLFVLKTRFNGASQGIFFIDGPFWKEQRRFGLRQLRDYGFGRRFGSTENIYESGIKSLIEQINTAPTSVNRDVHSKQGRILIPDLFYAFLSNSVLHMIIGESFDERELREIARCSIKLFQNIDTTGRIISIFQWLKHIAPDYFGYNLILEDSKTLTDFMSKIIKKRENTFSDDHKTDFMDTYFSKINELEREGGYRGSFTDKQFLWSMIDFFFPAATATGPSIQVLWSYLCRHPEVQAKIQEEIDRVVGRSRLPSLDDRKNMPYTEAVVREALRIDPVLPINTARRCTEDTTLAGFNIPKDTLIFVNIHNANSDPSVWENPSKFEPERYLDKNGNLLKQDYLLTFGAGKRLCAGETFARNIMFLLLAGLVQNFTFKSDTKLPPTNDDIKLWGFVIGLPPFWVDCISR